MRFWKLFGILVHPNVQSIIISIIFVIASMIWVDLDRGAKIGIQWNIKDLPVESFEHWDHAVGKIICDQICIN